MAKVLMHVSSHYDGETFAPGDTVVCDPDFARRAVLCGHGDLLENGTALSFEAACERLRADPADIAAMQTLKAAILADAAASPEA